MPFDASRWRARVRGVVIEIPNALLVPFSLLAFYGKVLREDGLFLTVIDVLSTSEYFRAILPRRVPRAACDARVSLARLALLTRRTCCGTASCTSLRTRHRTGRRGGGRGSARMTRPCVCAPKRPIGAGWSRSCQCRRRETPPPATAAVQVGRARGLRIDDQLLEVVQGALEAATEAWRSHEERLKARGVLHVLVGGVVVVAAPGNAKGFG